MTLSAYTGKGALHPTLFETHAPIVPDLVKVLDAIDNLQILARMHRRNQELSILHDAQNIVERRSRGGGGGGGHTSEARSLADCWEE